MAGLRFSDRVVNDFIVIEVGGELDYVSAPSFHDRTTALVGPDRRCVVVDLSGLAFMDSSGLAEVVRLWRRVAAEGGSLRLAGAHGAVAQMLAWTGVGRRLDLFPDLDTALRTPPEHHADGR